MARIDKTDILNYEAPLARMARVGIYYPQRPPWEFDGEVLTGDLWLASPYNDGEKAGELIREVFLTQASFAAFVGKSLSGVERLLANPTTDTTDTWGEEPGSPAERFWTGYLVFKTCDVLLKLVTPQNERLLCPPGRLEELKVELAKLRVDPDRWITPHGQPLLALGTMLALVTKDYSCWTDQWRWPAE